MQSCRTLIVNCMPAGVQVPSRVATVFDAGPRADVAIGVTQDYAPWVDQLIFTGESGLIKKTLEDGLELGIDWPSLRVQLAIGEEGLPESCRTYLALLIGADIDADTDRRIFFFWRANELGMNLCHESLDSIRVRRQACADPVLRDRLFRAAEAWCPMLFHYDPRNVFVEVLPGQEPVGDLLFSTLSLSRRLPLLRYRTGDRGELMSVKRIEAILAEVTDPVEFRCQDPCVAIYGRGDFVEGAGAPLYAQAVREGLYHDPQLAGQVTGNFHLRGGSDAAIVFVQAKPGSGASARTAERLEDAIQRYTRARITVRWFDDGTFADAATIGEGYTHGCTGV